MENNKDTIEPKNFILNHTQENYKGKYLTHLTKRYSLESDPNKIIHWECCYRSEVAHYKKISGAEVIALIKEESDDQLPNSINDLSILLIENYRYPVEKKVLEFPSGIIEHDDFKEIENLHLLINSTRDLEEIKKMNEECEKKLRELCINSAARELKEETGYTGEFKGFFSLPNVQPIKIFEKVFYDPWKSEENAALCVFEINKSHHDNRNPQQELEDAEVIKTHEVKIKNLINFISEKIEKENYGCSQHLYTFAMGLQFNEFLKNLKIIQ